MGQISVSMNIKGKFKIDNQRGAILIQSSMIFAELNSNSNQIDCMSPQRPVVHPTAVVASDTMSPQMVITSKFPKNTVKITGYSF